MIADALQLPRNEANIPLTTPEVVCIGDFHLKKSGTYHEYMRRLICAFSKEAGEGVACRSLISVSYDGRIYDCDFNQMMGMQITNRRPLTVFNFNREALLNREILFASHCFGCTAGGGSS